MLSRPAPRAVLCAGALLASASMLAEATVIVVDSLDTETLPPDACSIRNAFYAATQGVAYGTCPAGSGYDVIVLPQGAVFEFTQGWPEGGQGQDALAAITSDVVLIGNGATLQSLVQPCTLDTEFRWFDVYYAGHLSLFDVTLAGGCINDYGVGGSIWVGGALDLDHVTIRDSSADAGGGAIESVQGSTLTIRDSTFLDNAAPTYSFGGAIQSDGTTTIMGSYFGGNSAGNGSAIASTFGDVTLLNSVFAGNVSFSGALSLGTGEIGFSTFSGNDGGALESLGDIAITASLFTGGRGGNASPNCHFYANPPVVDAASWSDDPSCGSMAVADRADIALGDAGDYGGAIPLLPLLPSSIAIDDSGCLFGLAFVNIDARGVPRPTGAACDAGAYEFDGVDHTPPPQHFGVGNLLLSFDDRVSEYSRDGARVRDAWYPYRAPSDGRMSGIDAESLDAFRVALGQSTPSIGRYRVDQDRWAFVADAGLSTYASGTSVAHAGTRSFIGDIRFSLDALHGVAVFENGALIGAIPSAGDIHDVTMGRDGKLYVLANNVPGFAVRRYDPATLAELGAFDMMQTAGVAGGEALAVDAAGNVYVAGTDHAAIMRFDADGHATGGTDCVVPGNTVACAAIRSLAFADDGLLFAGTSTGYLFALEADFSSGFSAEVQDGEAYPGNGFRLSPLPTDAIFAGTFDP